MLIGDADEEANGEAWKLAVESAGDVKPAIRSNEDVRSLEDEVKAMEDEEVRELEDEVKAMEDEEVRELEDEVLRALEDEDEEMEDEEDEATRGLEAEDVEAIANEAKTDELIDALVSLCACFNNSGQPKKIPLKKRSTNTTQTHKYKAPVH